eukprot:jgi/Phyca11/119566/e_gw1.39.428.1
MPGLSASELPPETLHAGNTVEYFSRAFVCGDTRGYRSVVVTQVDTDDNDFLISFDTQEVVPQDLLLKRVTDHLPWQPARRIGVS